MYTLLAGVRVLELSLLAPSMVGMHLADLGADVIKIEPPLGDHTRQVGGPFRSGPSLNHLRWNRGKRSVVLDLKTAGGKAAYLQLAQRADVVIDGLRAGATDRLGIGHSSVAHANARVVYCAISGLGHSGPYRSLASHGVAYDAFAGLAPVAFRPEGGTPFIGPHVAIGTRIAPIFAALGICAALVQAQRTGKGSQLDIAEIDASALVQSDDLMRLLNVGDRRSATPFKDAVRYQYYATADAKFVIFQAYERKFWVNFCRAVERQDLLESDGSESVPPNRLDTAAGNEMLHHQLVAIFKQKTQSEWVEFFIKSNVPGGPVHTLEEMVSDPQFVARENIVAQEHPVVGELQMPTTPIKVRGENFSGRHAPTVGEHTDDVLREWLAFDDDMLAHLRHEGAIP